MVLREEERPLLGLFIMGRTLDFPERLRAQTWEEPPLIIMACAQPPSVQVVFVPPLGTLTSATRQKTGGFKLSVQNTE